MIVVGAGAAGLTAACKAALEGASVESRTALRLQPVVTYPDLPGATSGERVLEPVPFDASTLEAKFRLLRDPLAEFNGDGSVAVTAVGA